MGLLGIKLHKGKIWDSEGKNLLGIKWFPQFAKHFKFKDKYTFNVNMERGSCESYKGFLWDTYFYHYNIKCPEPLIMAPKGVKVILNPEDYNTLLNTEQLAKLNQVHKKGLLDLLNPKTLIIIGVVCLLLYLLFTGKLNNITGGF